MKKYGLLGLLLIITLAACGTSPEGEELAEYHNAYVENVNTLASQVDEAVQKSFATESPEDTYKIQSENVLPLIAEVKEYIESRKPKTDVVKEVHELRLKQLAAWEEAFQLQYQALEKTVDKASEEEVSELLKKSDEKLVEAAEFAQKADQQLLESAKEYNVVLN